MAQSPSAVHASELSTIILQQLVQYNVSETRLTQILLDDRPGWAFRNMYTFSGANVIIKAALDARPSLYDFHSITNMFLIFCPIIIAAFFIASHFFRYVPGLKQRFMAIRKEERIIAIFHVMFTVSFAIKIVPQTIWTVHLLYGPHFPLQFNNNYKRLWACAITNALMYLAEGTVRSVVRINPFLVLHHIFYYVFFMVPMIRDDVWGQKLILLLDCFIPLCELPLYISLLAHRFVVSTRKVKVVTYLCCAWSVALRILELVILICYFSGTHRRMKEWGDLMMWGWFLALAIPGGAIVCCFSLGIFWWFLVKRDRNPQRYGPDRYRLPPKTSNTSMQSLASADGVRHGVNDPLSVPPKLDP